MFIRLELLKIRVKVQEREKQSLRAHWGAIVEMRLPLEGSRVVSPDSWTWQCRMGCVPPFFVQVRTGAC